MTLTRRLLPYAAEQHGLITTADAREAGVTAMALVMAARRGTIERVDWGIYRIPELGGDPLARLQEALLRLPGAVLTEDTALELWELADMNPRRIRVALPRKVRVRRVVPTWIELVRTTIEPEDVTYHEGLAGRARFSKDLDVAFRRDISQLEGMLAGIAVHPVGHFVVEPVGLPKPIGAIFEGRRKQAWPPALAIQPSWRHDCEQEARENDFPVTDVEEACHRVTAMIERIARV